MTAQILVVDDLEPNVKLLEAKLQAEYYDVITAMDGFQAIEQAKKFSPDIILLDVMMPQIDGFETCRRLKADPATAHIPVVMVTALSDPSDRIQGLQAGADDFITKPIKEVQLLARVRSLVRIKMLIDELRLRGETSSQLAGISGEDLEALMDITGEHILLVDDDIVQSRQVIESLEQQGLLVSHISEPEECVAAAMQGEYDMFIISTQLADMDGLRLCSQLRSNDKTRYVPQLIMVDEDDERSIIKGLEMGVNDYLVNPIDLNEMICRVRTNLRRKKYQDALKSNYRKSVSMAITDSLTGLYNRHYLNAHLEKLVRHAHDKSKPLACLMLDMDHFKSVNDTYGHDVGDEVLKELSRRIVGQTRSSNLVARFGGEEFVVLLPGADITVAREIAERIRQAVEIVPFTISHPQGPINKTLSIGVAALRLNDPKDTGESMMKRGDEALYQSKHQGRNRVTIAEDDALLSSSFSAAHLMDEEKEQAAMSSHEPTLALDEQNPISSAFTPGRSPEQHRVAKTQDVLYQPGIIETAAYAEHEEEDASAMTALSGFSSLAAPAPVQPLQGTLSPQATPGEAPLASGREPVNPFAVLPPPPTTTPSVRTVEAAHGYRADPYASSDTAPLTQPQSNLFGVGLDVRDIPDTPSAGMSFSSLPVGTEASTASKTLSDAITATPSEMERGVPLPSTPPMASPIASSTLSGQAEPEAELDDWPAPEAPMASAASSLQADDMGYLSSRMPRPRELEFDTEDAELTMAPDDVVLGISPARFKAEKEEPAGLFGKLVGGLFGRKKPEVAENHPVSATPPPRPPGVPTADMAMVSKASAIPVRPASAVTPYTADSSANLEDTEDDGFDLSPPWAKSPKEALTRQAATATEPTSVSSTEASPVGHTPETSVIGNAEPAVAAPDAETVNMPVPPHIPDTTEVVAPVLPEALPPLDAHSHPAISSPSLPEAASYTATESPMPAPVAATAPPPPPTAVTSPFASPFPLTEMALDNPFDTEIQPPLREPEAEDITQKPETTRDAALDFAKDWVLELDQPGTGGAVPNPSPEPTAFTPAVETVHPPTLTPDPAPAVTPALSPAVSPTLPETPATVSPVEHPVSPFAPPLPVAATAETTPMHTEPAADAGARNPFTVSTNTATHTTPNGLLFGSQVHAPAITAEPPVSPVQPQEQRSTQAPVSNVFGILPGGDAHNPFAESAEALARRAASYHGKPSHEEE